MTFLLRPFLSLLPSTVAEPAPPMASPPRQLLTYSPPWYRLGDADYPLMAFAYGLLAACTVWVFESLIHNILFTSDLHISVAEAASLFTFKGANWWDIFRWSVRGRGLRRNKRAHIAILLRIVIIAVDVCIIVCAVPRELVVFEKDIGNPMINFQRRGNALFKTPNAAVLEFNSCIWDKTTFDSFTPNAAILVCSTQNTFEGTKSLTANTSELAFMVTYNQSMERLVFNSMSDNAVFFITHNLFLPSDETRNATTFSLPLPVDVAEQAIEALSNDADFRQKCRSVRRQNMNEPAQYFTCNRQFVRDTNDLRQKVIIATMQNVFTEKIDPSERLFRKVKPAGAVEIDNTGRGAEIGTVNRPFVVSFHSFLHSIFSSQLTNFR